MLKRILFNAGQTPTKSWSRFKIGSGLFLLGAVLLYFSQVYTLLYWPGFVVVITGFAYAMWGYWGIFANRFAQLLQQRDINAEHDPFANHDKTPKQD